MPRARSRPQSIERFSDFILATGGRPLLRMGGEERLIRGPFYFGVSITDNAVVNADLTLQSAADQRINGLYGSAAVPIEGTLHLEGFELRIVDGGYRSETPALKATLEQTAYIRTIRGGKTQDFGLRGRVSEFVSQFEFHEATNTAVERVIHAGKPWMLERPLRFELRQDKLSFRVDTAINWAGTNVQGYVVVYGHLAPYTFPGAQGQDASCGGGVLTDAGNDTFDQYAGTDPLDFGVVSRQLAPMGLGQAMPVNMLGG